MLHELAKVLRYPRLLKFFGLTEELVFESINFLPQSAEMVTLDPVVNAPIRDVNDVIVMQTAILDEANVQGTGSRVLGSAWYRRHG